MPTTHHTFCRICESLCGLEVEIEGDQITSIKPDREHVATRGFACVKGIKQQKMYSSPDRLTHPLKRVDGEYVPISWEQANAEIGGKLKQLIADHGADTVAMYVGTAAGFGVLHPIFAAAFMDGIGSGSLYASATQDCANKFAVAADMYGFPFTQPFPDIPNTECLIITGANPVVSKWSFLQVPNPFIHLHEMKKRGVKLFVIDPRETETAKAAGTWTPIRPDTDLFFFLAFLHEVFAQGGVDEGAVAAHMQGLEELRELSAPWTPERAAEVTRIPAADLREMVRTYLAADGAALYCSTGVNMGSQGSVCFWLQECINAITGNLDKPGGTVVGHGVFDFPAFGTKNNILTKPGTSRIGNFRRTNDALPMGLISDEILTEGEGQVRALFVTGGNPLLTAPNGDRMREAFGKLELMVTLDIYLNETSSVATHVLPCTTPFQRPDLPFVFPLFLGLQTKPYLQATRALLPVVGEQRDEATIYHDLARAAGVGLWGSKAASTALEGLRRFSAWRNPGKPPLLPQETLLNAFLRLTRQGSFKELADLPHGRLRPENAGEDFLGNRVYTDNGKIQLAPARIVERAREVIDPAYAHELANRDEFRLITKRQLTTHNSWTHNIEDFVRDETNHLYMRPSDADKLGLESGQMVDVESRTATVRLPLALLPELSEGTVAMPHGWGHQHAKGLSVASKARGVNVNLLAADGPENLERLSGMAKLTGIVVDVRPAAGPQNPESWSGI